MRRVNPFLSVIRMLEDRLRRQEAALVQSRLQLESSRKASRAWEEEHPDQLDVEEHTAIT